MAKPRSKTTSKRKATAKPKKPAAKPKSADKPKPASAGKASSKATPKKSVPTKVKPVTLAGLDVSIVAHDAASITVGGFASLEIAGRFGDALVLTCSILEVSAVLDLTDPPVLRPLASEFVQGCATARDGRFVALLGLSKKDRYVRVWPPSLEQRGARDIAVAKRVEFGAIGFAGERMVALPGDLGTHRRAFVMNPQQPYLEEDGCLAPMPALTPDDCGGAEEQAGVVACADGSDLIVWSGRIFELRGASLVRAVAFDLERNHNNSGFSAVAAAGRGFYAISSKMLVEVVPGEAAPRELVGDCSFNFVRPGPDGALLLWGAKDGSDTSGLWTYDLARRRATLVESPPGTYPMDAFYSKTRRAIGAVAIANEGTDGQRIVFANAR